MGNMKFNVKNLNWKIIITNLTVSIIMLIIIGSSAFYINTKINENVNNEKEKTQNEKILLNQQNINKLFINDIKLNNKIDSSQSLNELQHQYIIKELKRVSQDLRNLTYVITRNNTKIKNDIEELKKLQMKDQWANK